MSQQNPDHTYRHLGVSNCLWHITAPAKEVIQQIIFLILDKTIFCWYLLEAHPRGAFNESHQHMFMLRHKNNKTKNKPYLDICILVFLNLFAINLRCNQGNVVLYLDTNNKKDTCTTLVFYAVNLM